MIIVKTIKDSIIEAGEGIYKIKRIDMTGREESYIVEYNSTSTFDVEIDKTLELLELKHNTDNDDGYITELYMLRENLEYDENEFVKISDMEANYKMGSFSWLYADRTQREFTDDEQANMVYGDKVKFLIPEEFGGGFYEGIYQDYGKILCNEGTDLEMEFAIYDSIALMNDGKAREEFGGKVVIPFDQNNELTVIGVDIGCYDTEMANLKYPVKLVKSSVDITYEDCDDISFSDDKQGFYKYTFEELDNMDYRQGLDNKEYLELTREKGHVSPDKSIDFDL